MQFDDKDTKDFLLYGAIAFSLGLWWENRKNQKQQTTAAVDTPTRETLSSVPFVNKFVIPPRLPVDEQGHMVENDILAHFGTADKAQTTIPGQFRYDAHRLAGHQASSRSNGASGVEAHLV
jgi:hypothetical protein